MRTAIRKVGLDPKWNLSIGVFLNSLADEVQRLENGHETYRLAITEHAPASVDNYSQFAIDNISSPVFLTLHGVNTHYADKMEAIEALQESLSISKMEALKILLRQSIKNLNINMDYEFPLAETAIEILGCLRLADKLSTSTDSESRTEEYSNSNSSDQLHLDTSDDVTSEKDEPTTEKDIPSDVKPIDVDKIKDIHWQEADMFEEGRGVHIQDLAALEGGIFFIAKKWMQFDLYFSPDFIKLYKANSKNITGDESGLDYSSKLMVTNDTLFCLGGYGKCPSASDNGRKWRKLDFPTKCSGESLTYENVLFNGKIWVIAASYRPTYTYTKSGIIFDSTESKSFSACQLLIGSTLSDLRTFTFSDDYYKYNVKKVINSGEYFYAHLQHDRYDDTLLLKSLDGFKWDKISWNKDERIYSICPCKKGIIISGISSKLYTYYQEMQGLMILDISHDISSQWNENKFRYFPSHNLYALISNDDRCMYLSNNLSDWKSISLSNIFSSTHPTGLTIRGNDLVMSTHSSKIYYGSVAQA